MPDAELTQAMVVNWALAELGMAPKFTIEDQSQLGQQVAIFWPRCESRCFGLHDWTWCRRTALLTRHEATPVNGWGYGFDLPGDRIGPPLKLLTDPTRETPLRDYTIEGNALFTNAPVVYARCKVAVELTAWPRQFADAFATMLASYLAVPLMQDLDMAATKLREAVGTPSEGGAGGVFGRLIAQDRAGQPLASPLNSDILHGGRAADPWHGRY